MEEDIYITRDEFLAGQQWYWQFGDLDIWYYDSNSNKIKQIIGGAGLEADIIELNTTEFTYQFPNEDLRSYPFNWLIQYNG